MFASRCTPLIAAVAVLVCHLHCVAHHAWEAVQITTPRGQSHVADVPYSGGNQGTCDHVSGCICKGATLSASVHAPTDDATSFAPDFWATISLGSLPLFDAAPWPAFHQRPPAAPIGNARCAWLSSFRC
ncbi:MAG TPA: hypothetical protein VGE52_18040 [Pirellulales bacterium]